MVHTGNCMILLQSSFLDHYSREIQTIEFFSGYTGKSLLYVAFLGMVVLFIYSVLSFAFLWDRYYMTDDAVLYCDTLFQCYVSIIRYGLIDNLGLVSQMQAPYYNDLNAVSVYYTVECSIGYYVKS